MRYRRAGRTAWRKIAGETVVLDLEAKRMYGLNATAAFLWQILEAMPDAEAMERALVAGGDAEPLGVREIEAFLRELLDLGLVEAGEPEAVASEGAAPAALEPPASLEPPEILWQETVEQIAASCAFFPATNPLCNQVPFS